jgi:hypothetical protein
MTFRSDLDALRARHDVLESEVAARQKDLVETRRMIEEVERRARLPVLDNIRVAAPCTADWTKMPGDERVRACGDCNKNVYNLSGMTREEAEALLVEKEGRLCVRYYRRTDGTILFGDCTIGVSRRRRRKLVAGAAALLAATGIVAYGASRAVADEEEMEEMVEETVGVMGGLSAEPPRGAEMEMGKVADMPAPTSEQAHPAREAGEPVE